MGDTHMNFLARRIWTKFFTAVFLVTHQTRGAEEPRTFILDTSFDFKGVAMGFSGGYFYWNPPFIGGPKLALMANGQMMVTRTATSPGRSGLLPN